jgi:L-threonylcarbamoyladenylate synthase
MKQIQINLKKLNSADLKLIVDYLNKGKVIAYPTDTIYGLGCLANNRGAIKKIRRIKQQKNDQPFLILVDSLAMVKKYCVVGRWQSEFLKSVWPGPVTLVLRSRGILPKELSGGQDSLAVRLPKSDFIAKIIKKVKTPLVSTSLNKTGDKNLVAICGLEEYFGNISPDLAINAGKLQQKASKLVDLRDIESIKILRK